MNVDLVLSIVWAIWGFAFGFLAGDKLREFLWRS